MVSRAGDLVFEMRFGIWLWWGVAKRGKVRIRNMTGLGIGMENLMQETNRGMALVQ